MSDSSKPPSLEWIAGFNVRKLNAEIQRCDEAIVTYTELRKQCVENINEIKQQYPSHDFDKNR